MVSLILDFSCCSKLVLSWIDRITSGMYTFVFIITSVTASVELVMTQLIDQVKMRFILQLIRGISRVLQKILKYFNSTAISTSFVLPVLGVLLFILAFNLNDSESSMLFYGSSF